MSGTLRQAFQGLVVCRQAGNRGPFPPPTPSLVLIGLLVVAILSGCAAKPVAAVDAADGTQTVKVVVQHGYKPDHIVAKAGKPLKIEFVRDEDAGAESCDKDLVIPSENVNIHLPPHESQIVEIKPQPAGDVAFHCGMNMIKGTITFK